MNGSERGDCFLLWVLCGFGTGRLPIAPGTWGAVLALLVAGGLAWVAPHFFHVGLAFLALSAFVVGIIGVPRAEALWGKDPSVVVLDEMLGLWVALWAAPVEAQSWPIIFFLFRLFDVLKPLGIRWLERLPGGWGVMLDDVLAGVYASLIGRALWWLLQ